MCRMVQPGGNDLAVSLCTCLFELLERYLHLLACFALWLVAIVAVVKVYSLAGSLCAALWEVHPCKELTGGEPTSKVNPRHRCMHVNALFVRALLRTCAKQYWGCSFGNIKLLKLFYVIL